MFPVATRVLGTTTVPDGASFWMPKGSDITEEGIGYFRDVWLIKDVPVSYAREVIQHERRIATVVGDLANTAEDFDRLARAVEREALLEGEGEIGELTGHERTALAESAVDGSELDGLEVGIAGLVYALATVRIIPGASCRGHVGDTAWSDVPVVLFAATAHRAQALQPLVEGTGCRFSIDDARPDLITVAAPSILNTMALAEGVLESRGAFVRARSTPAPRLNATLSEDLLF